MSGLELDFGKQKHHKIEINGTKTWSFKINVVTLQRKKKMRGFQYFSVGILIIFLRKQ